MSSTSRGGQRHKSDYYITPHEPIRQFLSQWTKDDKDIGLYWLDPCAGGDESNPMSYPTVVNKELGIDVVTNDIRADSLALFKQDYLMSDFSGFDVVITNPPFDIAQNVIEKALFNTNRGGYVVMLLRLNFFGSQSRRAFFDKNMPYRVYVHTKRISFIKGQTDSIEYAHFIWKVGYKTETTLLKLI